MPKLANLMKIAISAMGALYLSSCDVDDWDYNCDDDGVSAFVFSELFVSDVLVSPSTADFADFTDPGVFVQKTGGEHLISCKWTVYSYVDAQNSFGATLRTHYVVKVTYKVKTDSWYLDQISIDE